LTQQALTEVKLAFIRQVQSSPLL